MKHFCRYIIRGLDTEKKGLTIPAPFQVHSCGHYLVGDRFHEYPKRKFFLELFWGMQGEARIVSEGKNYYLKPKTVFFYLPGAYHDIASNSSLLEYYWLTISGENIPDLIRQFHLQQKIYAVDSCPVNLFRHLEELMREYSLRGEYLAAATAYQIISLALSGPVQGKQLFDEFRMEIANYYQDSDLTIAAIADRLHVHISTLHRCLKDISGMSPGEYLINFRVNEALILLRQSLKPIKDIAAAVGFSNANYFTKVIRKHLGLTPCRIRRQGIAADIQLQAEQGDI